MARKMGRREGGRRVQREGGRQGKEMLADRKEIGKERENVG